MSRELLIIVLFGLFCCVIVVCSAQFICDNYLLVRLQSVQHVNKFLECVAGGLLIVLFGLFCGVIVVRCVQFIFGNYSRVRLQFLQQVSSLSRINVS